ncbi:hypothetical protein [Streptomyces sp. NPDC048277]|uniref:hypothetical protein n=1 Tax=Streptomyces sp. NPDC048277 TaxID=3155027 RepID=UPI0033DC5748
MSTAWSPATSTPPWATRAGQEAGNCGARPTTWAALFMTSPESRWITGTVLPVDAGTTASTGLGMLARLTAPDDNGAQR